MSYQNDINDILDIWEKREPIAHDTRYVELDDNPHSEQCRHCGGDTGALMACCDGEATEREQSDWCPDVAERDAPVEVES